jgi:hypothetical protein
MRLNHIFKASDCCPASLLVYPVQEERNLVGFLSLGYRLFPPLIDIGCGLLLDFQAEVGERSDILSTRCPLIAVAF